MADTKTYIKFDLATLDMHIWNLHRLNFSIFQESRVIKKQKNSYRLSQVLFYFVT
jgi:hypothetical protein